MKTLIQILKTVSRVARSIEYVKKGLPKDFDAENSLYYIVMVPTSDGTTQQMYGTDSGIIASVVAQHYGTALVEVFKSHKHAQPIQPLELYVRELVEDKYQLGFQDGLKKQVELKIMTMGLINSDEDSDQMPAHKSSEYDIN